MTRRLLAALACLPLLAFVVPTPPQHPVESETVMTTPTFNSAELDLPAAVANIETSSTITRVGVVSDIVEADNITVAISGSPTLVQASYLFPQYQPVLGDRVVVQKQDAQWFVLGTMSGPINSLVENPTFEQGIVGSTPTSWTLSVVSSAGGTPTFTKEYGPDVSGNHYGWFRCGTGGGGGVSTADLFSTAVPALPSERWVMGYYLLFAYINTNAAQVSQSGDSRLEGFIQFLDATDVLISETSANFIYLGANLVNRMYLRTTTTSETHFAQAPAGTVSARIRLRGQFTNSANSTTAMGIDYMILRRV